MVSSIWDAFHKIKGNKKTPAVPGFLKVSLKKNQKLLDFCFLENAVLACNWVVLAIGSFFRLCAWVFLAHIEITGAQFAYKTNLNACSFCHFLQSISKFNSVYRPRGVVCQGFPVKKILFFTFRIFHAASKITKDLLEDRAVIANGWGCLLDVVNDFAIGCPLFDIADLAIFKGNNC